MQVSDTCFWATNALLSTKFNESYKSWRWGWRFYQMWIFFLNHIDIILFFTKTCRNPTTVSLIAKNVEKTRAVNLLIGFPSESLIFYPKMSEWAIGSKKQPIHSFAHFWWVTWAVCSRSLSSSERCEQIAHGRSFLVSDLSDWFTSLIVGERPERFTHQKRGNERFALFLNKKRVYKTY